MSYTLIESLNNIRLEAVAMATIISEAITDHPDRTTIIESADQVLGTLAAKLKAGGLQGAEVDEYAQLYASLSLLAQDTVRHAYNIDLKTPAGKQKFSNVVNGVGENPKVTDQVKRVASVNGQSHLNQIKQDLQNFAEMDPQKQQQYINSINKLRLGYEQVKNTMGKPTAQAPAQNAPVASAPGASTGDAAGMGGGNSGAAAPSTTFA